MNRLLPILFLLTGCSFNPPPNTGAYKRGLTETKESKARPDTHIQNQMRLNERMMIEPRPAPIAMPDTYSPYVNSGLDQLIEAPPQPPLPPGYGPMPIVPQAAVSNWMTPKASAILPKPMMTNQVPGSVILSRITTTDDKGKKFSAELELLGEQRIQANDKMAVVIFAVAYTNYSIQVCTNLTEGKWNALSSGVSQNTNGAIVIVDLDQGTHPLKFYRQVKAAP